MLYIVPLQDEFDLSPLPSDAQEFSQMPKAECKKCFESMPLQILALHVKECNTAECETLSDSEPELSNLPPDSPNLSPATEEKFYSEEDVLRWIAAHVDTSKEFSICVSRMNLLERGMSLWKHQKLSSPINTLKVTFMGEAGVDTGALRKEFLTEMISGIETWLFEGEDGKGKMPKYSINDLDNGLFRVAGEIFAIEETSDLSKYSDQIMSCGYTGPINDQNKGNIKRAIAMHAAARWTLMLQQLSEGLQLYHLLDIMEKNKEVCRSLFVFEGGNDQVDSQYIVSHLDPKMSESGTLKHSKEMQILNNFQDFLMELEDGDPEDEEALSVSKKRHRSEKDALQAGQYEGVPQGPLF
ncbi:G2 M phase-specific E3 ubiquitin- ligase-like isoform X2 [Labeo rohita]|uniref:G2 M phase-specific E3 ubiquitin-ligase-like isoform X2 n=1 Tax=Labeo rohita TaxID=84645 RepID=A0A498MDZ2_LABRO|nr:G2 M phase-specific E3 ubiquitin- ligase-like isoform X2 [Labeo rohita]